ncbi:MAG: ATP-binding protein [Pseudobdellovibrio sp.]
MAYNSLIARLLKKLNLVEDSVPQSLEDWREFLNRVNTALDEAELSRERQEHMIDVSSNEMERLNKTIQTQAEQQIQKKEDQIDLVMESVPCMVGWVTSDLILSGVNNELSAAYGLKPENFVGQHLNWKLDSTELISVMTDFFKSKKMEVSFSLNLLQSGNLKNFKVVAKKYSDQKMAVIVALDVTDDILKQKELDTVRIKSLASSRMALLGEMGAGIAHEINSPLTIINSTIKKIMRDIHGENFEKTEIIKKLETLESTTHRVAKIIKGLRTFARDGEGDPFEKVLLKSILDDSLELCEARLRSANIEYRQPNVSNDLFLECRATQISQVIINLISNSRDAIESLEERWIKVEVNELEDKIVLSVTDSGKGIPEELHEKILNPFFTTKAVGSGTGLGLSISKGIIEAHNGKIYYDSKNFHTRFVAELPKIHIKKNN